MEGVKITISCQKFGIAADLTRQQKHSRQKQQTSVVIFSELVAINATSFIKFVSVDRPTTTKLRFRLQRHFPILTQLHLKAQPCIYQL